MANDEHVAILKKGVAAWNKWRDLKTPALVADLREANLAGADLGRGEPVRGEPSPSEPV